MMDREDGELVLETLALRPIYHPRQDDRGIAFSESANCDLGNNAFGSVQSESGNACGVLSRVNPIADEWSSSVGTWHPHTRAMGKDVRAALKGRGGCRVFTAEMGGGS